MLGESVPSAGIRGFIWRVRKSIFGIVPEVTRFHTRWPDYSMPRDELRQVVSNNGRLLVVADQPSRFAHWVTAMTSDVFTLEWDRLIAARPNRALGGMPEWYRSLIESFDACLVVVTEPMLETATGAMERLGALLKLPGQISIMILNDRPFHNAAAFSEVFARNAAELLDRSSWQLEIHYISATRLRWLVYRLSDQVLERLRDAYKRGSIALPLWGALAIGLGIATYLANFRVRSTTSPPSGLWSSVFLMLRRTHRDSREDQYRAVAGWSAPRFGNRDTQNFFAATDDDKAGETVAATAVANKFGGWSSIRIAHDIAAKLLAGRHDVGIYGFDEADAMSLAVYKVRRMAIYDSHPTTIGGQRHGGGPPLPRIQFHDMLGSPLPRVHDSICSLRALGYVPSTEEDTYIEHLADSLAHSSNTLILGCPSNRGPEEPMEGGDPVAGLVSNRPMDRQRYHYARTGAQLKALAERFFENVFVFSIIDGELQVGAVSSADYVLAVCCARRDRTEQSRSAPKLR